MRPQAPDPISGWVDFTGTNAYDWPRIERFVPDWDSQPPKNHLEPDEQRDTRISVGLPRGTSARP